MAAQFGDGSPQSVGSMQGGAQSSGIGQGQNAGTQTDLPTASVTDEPYGDQQLDQEATGSLQPSGSAVKVDEMR